MHFLCQVFDPTYALIYCETLAPYAILYVFIQVNDDFRCPCTIHSQGVKCVESRTGLTAHARELAGRQGLCRAGTLTFQH